MIMNSKFDEYLNLGSILNLTQLIYYYNYSEQDMKMAHTQKNNRHLLASPNSPSLEK